jgi:CHRD domain
MRKHRVRTVMGGAALAVGLVAAGAPALAATDAADRGSPPRIAVGALRLSGQQEVPPNNAGGRGTFVYVAFDSRICYVLTAQNIDPATMAHIHDGPVGVNGPIVIALIAPTDGFSADCIRAVPDGSVPNSNEVLLQSELDAIIASEPDFYVNVHNTPFPGGVIRAQLRCCVDDILVAGPSETGC